MKFNDDENWLKNKAKIEDGCFVSVGGLITELDENIDGEILYSSEIHTELDRYTFQIRGGMILDKIRAKELSTAYLKLLLAHSEEQTSSFYAQLAAFIQLILKEREAQK